MPDLQSLLNPEFIKTLVQQNQQQYPYQQQGTVQTQTNEYGVPIVYTEPDVILRGRLEVEVRFKHADIQGRSGDQLRELAYSVIMGNRGPGLPEITPGLFTIWQEVPKQDAPAKPQQEQYDPIQAQRIIGRFLAELGRSTSAGSAGEDRASDTEGIREGGAGRDFQGIGDPPPRGFNHGGEGGGGSPYPAILRDSDHGHGEVAGDSQPTPGSAVRPDPPGEPRHRRSRRPTPATDEPRVPEAELENLGEKIEDQ